MISIRTALPLLCSLMLGAGVAQAADIYKWVDEQGSTHYSDAAPKGAHTGRGCRRTSALFRRTAWLSKWRAPRAAQAAA